MKNCHIEMNRWFEEAMSLEEHPKETAIKVLHVAARTLGAQIARLAGSEEPAEIPKLLAETIDSLGQGVTAGGRHGEMSVRMFSVSGGPR